MEFKGNRELILKQGGMHCTTLFLVINCKLYVYHFRHEEFAHSGLRYPVQGLTLSANSVIIYTTNTKEGFW